MAGGVKMHDQRICDSNARAAVKTIADLEQALKASTPFLAALRAQVDELKEWLANEGMADLDVVSLALSHRLDRAMKAEQDAIRAEAQLRLDRSRDEEWAE